MEPSPSNFALARAVSDYASERLAEVVEALELDLIDGGRDYNGPCPVHGGDNQTALHLYSDGHSRKGNWFCASHQCQGHFGKDLFGFVRGVLSHKEKGWEQPGDDWVSVDFTQKWLCGLFGIDPTTLLTASPEKDRSDEINRWSRKAERLAPQRPVSAERGWTRERVRRGLKIPSPYFLSRGFPAGILDRYDVGEPLADRPGPLRGRAVVPVYNLAGERCIGFTGRLASDVVPDGVPKWHHEGFAAGTVLFNLWLAKPSIRKTKRVVLVEGPGDCLKLVAAGMENVVSTFGTSISDAQTILLEVLGVMECALLYDFDEAGRQAVAKVKKQLGRSFRVTVPDWRPSAGKDVGGCEPDELKALVEML